MTAIPVDEGPAVARAAVILVPVPVSLPVLKWKRPILLPPVLHPVGCILVLLDLLHLELVEPTGPPFLSRIRSDPDRYGRSVERKGTGETARNIHVYRLEFAIGKTGCPWHAIQVQYINKTISGTSQNKIRLTVFFLLRSFVMSFLN